MAPREHEVPDPATGLVDAVSGRVHGMLRVGVLGEGIGVDNFLAEGAAYDEGVA